VDGSSIDDPKERADVEAYWNDSQGDSRGSDGSDGGGDGGGGGD
jgi:hypothetical protein